MKEKNQTKTTIDNKKDNYNLNTKTCNKCGAIVLNYTICPCCGSNIKDK